MNISSDFVQLLSKSKALLLERNNIENTLGIFLLQEKAKSDFKSIFLINGPGGFTNLRVGGLSINILNTLFKNQIAVYNISKISLYEYLYVKGFLPELGYIYIGQKNNCRKYNFKTGVSESITKSEIQYEGVYFLDCVFEEGYRKTNQNMLEFSTKTNLIKITLLNNNYTVSAKELLLSPQYQVIPNYMIEAVKSQ